MRKITTFFAISLIGLFPISGLADENQPPLEAEQKANDTLAQLAANTRDAVLMLQVEDGTKRPFAFGVFISNDGVALVNLQAFLKEGKPPTVIAHETFLKFGKILEVFPEQELALMKFNYRPKAHLSIAKLEPEIGEQLALVPLDAKNPYSNKVPPVLGPVMAKRSSVTPNLKVNRFTRVLSLGSGLSFEQRRMLGPGCFAIDRNGDLVAFTNDFQRVSGQTIIGLAPIVTLAAEIQKLSKNGKDLGFPLPESKYPFDPAAVDPDFHPLNVAMQRMNIEEVKQLLPGLLARYPDSQILKSKDYWLKLVIQEKNPDGNGILDFPEPDPEASKIQQVEQWSKRAISLANKKQDDAAIKAFQSAIKLSPKDYPEVRLQLAVFHGRRGRFADAEAIFREVYPLMSDSVSFITMYERTLLNMKDFKGSRKISKRGWELEKIYRRP